VAGTNRRRSCVRRLKCTSGTSQTEAEYGGFRASTTGLDHPGHEIALLAGDGQYVTLSIYLIYYYFACYDTNSLHSTVLVCTIAGWVSSSTDVITQAPHPSLNSKVPVRYP
jgi:hypothetical protein